MRNLSGSQPLPSNLCCISSAEFHNYEKRKAPRMLPREPDVSFSNACARMFGPHMSRSICARSRVCSFLVSGCEICGFSQSGLIFASLSFSQQIIVKYTHAPNERGRDTEFTFNYSLTSQGQISGACLQRKHRNDTWRLILAGEVTQVQSCFAFYVFPSVFQYICTLLQLFQLLWP